jgi:predicted AAA+ superfamily ATPase
MTFDEFLLAARKKKLLDFFSGYTVETTIPQAIHDEASRLLRHYLILGGLLASVFAFVESGDHRESEAVRQSLLSTFRDDFAKYARRVSPARIDKVFRKIPRLLGSKMVYSRIDKEERSRDLSKALEMLCMARVSHKVRHTAANGIPLGAEARDNTFKVIFLDVGLLCRSLGLTVLDIEDAPDVMLINAGAVCEQFVGQHLLHAGEPYEEPELFYWMRQKKRSSAEVDYLMSIGEQIIPVEVKAGKAGKTGTLKSMHSFLQAKGRNFALRLNTDTPSLLEAKTSLATGNNKPFRLLSLPLYLIGQTRRLAREGLHTSCRGPA